MNARATAKNHLALTLDKYPNDSLCSRALRRSSKALMYEVPVKLSIQAAWALPPLEHAVLPFQIINSIFSSANFVFALPEGLA